MDKLVEELWCKMCDKSISLRFLLNEKRRGIASKCSIQCKSCNNIIVIETSTSKSQDYLYDANLKLAIGKKVNKSISTVYIISI